MACLAPCVTDIDCKSDERCFELPSAADAGSSMRSCFQSCEQSATVCAFEFDCADYYRKDQYLCLPTEWVRNWPPVQP
jgi:hypothetical protein